MTYVSAAQLRRAWKLGLGPPPFGEDSGVSGDTLLGTDDWPLPGIYYLPQSSGTALTGVSSIAGIALDRPEFVTSTDDIRYIFTASDTWRVLEDRGHALSPRLLFKVVANSDADTTAGMPQERRRAQAQDDAERFVQRQKNQAAIALLKAWRADMSDQREQAASLERTIEALNEGRAGARRLFP